jgi:hypothetical protein
VVVRMPWRRGRATGAEGPVFVSATELVLVRARDLPRAYLDGVRMRRTSASLEGSVGLWIWAQPLRRRSGAVSVWRGEGDLRAFVSLPAHQEIMRRYRGASAVRSWSWTEGHLDRDGVWQRARVLIDASAHDLGQVTA